MSKLDELINDLCPDEVEYKMLGIVSNIYDGTHSTPKYTLSGVKFVSVQNINSLYESNKFISQEDYDKFKIKPKYGDVFMTRIGDVGTATVVDSDEPIAYYVSLALIRTDKTVNPYYLKYYINSKYFKKELNKRIIHTAVPIKINLGEIGKCYIALPPLPVQEEIVRILDKSTELTAELNENLTAELTARRKQYEYYRDNLYKFSDDVQYRPLYKIADIGTGSSNTNEELEVGEYPFFVRSQEVRKKDTYEYDETAIITSGDGVGVGKIFHYVEGKYALHQRAYRIHIKTDDVLPKYYFQYMKSVFLPYIEKNSFHSSVTSIRRPMLNNFPVPVPPLPEQQRIVEILDRFDALCNDIIEGLPAEIKARQQQYEYYRDKLLTFKEKETPQDE